MSRSLGGLKMKKNRGLIRATAAGSVVAMTLVAAPALARPAQRPVWPKKATVSLGQQAVSGGAYSIPASWSKTTYTTEFRVALKDAANNSLDSETVPSTTVSWTAHTTARPGTQVHVVVTPYNGTRAGASKSSATISLKDMTPPQGTYTAKTNVYTATLTQQSLSDDAGAAGVTRTVEWGDGSSDPWGTGSTMTHTYAAQGSYRAVVHLKDAAGNTTDVPVDIVVKDSTAPSGTYSASWSDWTGTISQDVAPSDDFDGANVSATVDWADGSPTEAWTPGAATMSHDYQSKGQGRYIATVTLADSSGNSRVYQLPVLIHDDLAPVATYTVSTATRTVWARYTKVKLTQADSAGASSVDNMSPDSAVKRVVRWGDKTSTAGFAATTSLTHVYAAAGTYHPVVTLTDESGHVTKVDVDAVV